MSKISRGRGGRGPDPQAKLAIAHGIQRVLGQVHGCKGVQGNPVPNLFDFSPQAIKASQGQNESHAARTSARGDAEVEGRRFGRVGVGARTGFDGVHVVGRRATGSLGAASSSGSVGGTEAARVLVRRAEVRDTVLLMPGPVGRGSTEPSVSWDAPPPFSAADAFAAITTATADYAPPPSTSPTSSRPRPDWRMSVHEWFQDGGPDRERATSDPDLFWSVGSTSFDGSDLSDPYTVSPNPPTLPAPSLTSSRRLELFFAALARLREAATAASAASGAASGGGPGGGGGSTMSVSGSSVSGSTGSSSSFRATASNAHPEYPAPTPRDRAAHRDRARERDRERLQATVEGEDGTVRVQREPGVREPVRLRRDTIVTAPAESSPMDEQQSQRDLVAGHAAEEETTMVSGGDVEATQQSSTGQVALPVSEHRSRAPISAAAQLRLAEHGELFDGDMVGRIGSSSPARFSPGRFFASPSPIPSIQNAQAQGSGDEDIVNAAQRLNSVVSRSDSRISSAPSAPSASVVRGVGSYSGRNTADGWESPLVSVQARRSGIGSVGSSETLTMATVPLEVSPWSASRNGSEAQGIRSDSEVLNRTLDEINAGHSVWTFMDPPRLNERLLANEGALIRPVLLQSSVEEGSLTLTTSVTPVTETSLLDIEAQRHEIRNDEGVGTESMDSDLIGRANRGLDRLSSLRARLMSDAEREAAATDLTARVQMVLDGVSERREESGDMESVGRWTQDQVREDNQMLESTQNVETGGTIIGGPVQQHHEMALSAAPAWLRTDVETWSESEPELEAELQVTGQSTGLNRGIDPIRQAMRDETRWLLDRSRSDSEGEADAEEQDWTARSGRQLPSSTLERVHLSVARLGNTAHVESLSVPQDSVTDVSVADMIPTVVDAAIALDGDFRDFGEHWTDTHTSYERGDEVFESEWTEGGTGDSNASHSGSSMSAVNAIQAPQVRPSEFVRRPGPVSTAHTVMSSDGGRRPGELSRAVAQLRAQGTLSGGAARTTEHIGALGSSGTWGPPTPPILPTSHS
ncbi:hypothetical protein HDU93_007513 [Gonapodya sp. JEL0774]|nr:hypothetical protein HDU93_007513 [Gonapodya sp. JEL0774]